MAIAPISATRLSETRTWSHSYRCLFHARIICILLWDSLSIIIIIIALRFTHMINIIIIIIAPTPIMTPRQIMAPTTADNSSSVPLRASVEGGPPGGRYHNILNFLYVVFKASSLSDKALKREKNIVRRYTIKLFAGNKFNVSATLRRELWYKLKFMTL